MAIKFRKILKKDVGALQKFYAANGMANAASVSNKFLLRCVESDLKNYISFFVAEYKNEIVGAVYFVDHGGLVTVWSLAVNQNYRKMGVGTALIKMGLKTIDEKGRSMISAIVDPVNLPSLGLFKKLGFSRERNRIRLDKIIEK